MIHEILKQYWGYDAFRPLQEDIIRSVLAGHDTLALLPTGGGKSICFQVPAMALEGLCIVVSPLIALMQDQVSQLNRRGIRAEAIHSGMHPREIDILLDNCVFGQVKFLYVSPERLQTELFIERARRMKIGLLAVDEAHCISQWGYDFRPPYLEIAAFRKQLPPLPVIALTASATVKVQEDIMQKLEFKNGKLFKKSFARALLSYSSLYHEDKEKKMLQILERVKGTAIVYVRSRKRTGEMAGFLQRQGLSASYYHAGLTHALRTRRQDDWIKGRTRVIVATNAFGMGIDKPDVRTVIHMDLPENLEAYYQEAGRAGRDEKKAYAVILFNSLDVDQLRQKVTQEYPAPETIRKVYQALANYLKIAAGSHPAASFDFDLPDFQRTYALPALDTFYALKKLEEEGFIQLNESYHQPSKLFMSASQQVLYEYQIANARQDQLIKTLLRMHGGQLFSHFVNIDEKQVAANARLSEQEVFSGLAALHQHEIAVYEKQKDRPQVIFTTARYDAAQLPLDIKKIEARKQDDIARMEAMIGYATHKFRCRSLLIQEYFGETDGRECGVCDLCTEKRKKAAPPDVYEKYRIPVLNALASGEMKVNQLISSLKPSSDKELIQCLRELTASGEIEWAGQDVVRIKR